MKKRKVQQHGLRDTEVLARDITSVSLNSKRWSQICVFFADTGRHVRSVHAAEELLRALHQDFPELVSEMNPFWDFASSSITRDPTAAGITISLQKISGNVSTQLGMKAGAAAPTIATPTTAAPTGTPTAVPTTAAPTPTVIGGLSALSQAISQKKAVSFATVPLEPMSPAADADPDPEHVPEPAQSASSCVNSNNSGDNSSPPIKRRATEAGAWDTWWKEHMAIGHQHWLALRRPCRRRTLKDLFEAVCILEYVIIGP